MTWPYRYDLLHRYRLIEIVALWEGKVKTNHLIEHFGIGRQQASKDINNYIKDVAPGNLTYNASAKGYQPSASFAPKVSLGRVDEYLQLIERNSDLHSTFESLSLGFEHSHSLPMPNAQVDPEILRPIIRACRNKERVEIDYRSLRAPNKDGRIIVPHAIVHAGSRWHVRAFCEKNQDFRDFVLTRFFDIPEILSKSDVEPAEDTTWQTRVNVCFKPDPRLNNEQQAIIANDFGMTNNLLVITVRAALVHYLMQAMRVDPNIVHADPIAQQIVIDNFDAIKQWLFR